MSPCAPGASPAPTSPPHVPAQPVDPPAPDDPPGVPGQTQTVDDPDRALGELTRVLRGLGLTARLLTPPTRPSFVRASHPGAPALAENITCAPYSGDSLYFWWSWDDPITPARQVEAAADSIHRVLAPEAGR